MNISIIENVKGFKLQNKRKYIQWAEEIRRELNIENYGPINFIFVGRNTIIKINKQFLKHKYITDVISFNYGVSKELFGEIYICIFQVKKNAKEYNVPFENELRRVMAHGILHLAGFEDGTSEERSKMREMEERMISLW